MVVNDLDLLFQTHLQKMVVNDLDMILFQAHLQKIVVNDLDISFQAHVQKIVVDGLDKTKDDLVQKKVKQTFQASTLEEVRHYLCFGSWLDIKGCQDKYKIESGQVNFNFYLIRE